MQDAGLPYHQQIYWPLSLGKCWYMVTLWRWKIIVWKTVKSKIFWDKRSHFWLPAIIAAIITFHQYRYTVLYIIQSLCSIQVHHGPVKLIMLIDYGHQWRSDEVSWTPDNPEFYSLSSDNLMASYTAIMNLSVSRISQTHLIEKHCWQSNCKYLCKMVLQYVFVMHGNSANFNNHW